MGIVAAAVITPLMFATFRVQSLPGFLLPDSLKAV
jgi:hypothetical protein